MHKVVLITLLVMCSILMGGPTLIKVKIYNMYTESDIYSKLNEKHVKDTIGLNEIPEF